MVKHYQFSVLTDDEYSYHYIGEQVNAYVKESGVTSGIVTTVVAHTHCGIVVTEPLECIMDDFKVLYINLWTTMPNTPMRIFYPPMDAPAPTPTAICGAY